MAKRPNKITKAIKYPIAAHGLELEGVQFFGLVDSPTVDSRVPVDSRVQNHWKEDIKSFQKSGLGLASPAWTRESF